MIHNLKHTHKANRYTKQIHCNNSDQTLGYHLMWLAKWNAVSNKKGQNICIQCTKCKNNFNNIKLSLEKSKLWKVLKLVKTW